MLRSKLALLVIAALFATDVSFATEAPPQSLQPKIVDADLTVVAESVGQYAGKRFVIDPRVRGQVNMSFENPITPAEFYEAYIAAVRALGFKVVEEEKVTRILPPGG